MSAGSSIDTHRGTIAWFARNPVAANLMMAVIVVVGIFSAIKAERALMPDIMTNVVQIIVPYPGAAPEEVEQGVIIKIEEALKDIESIKRVDATAAESVASFSIEILDDFDVQAALDEIKSAIDGIASFPEEIEKPVVKRLQFKRHAVNLQLSGNLDERSMSRLAHEMKVELLQDPAIGSVDIFGVRDYEIAIEVPESTLFKYQLTLEQIANAIRRSSLDLPGGAIKTDTGEIMVRTKGQARHQHEFEQVVLITHPDGTRLTLGDVATIRDGFVEQQGFSIFDRKYSVALAVSAVGDQDVVATADAAKRYMHKKQLLLPEGVYIDDWADVTFYLKGRLSMMLGNLGMGAILVFIILGLFLDIKLAFWVMVGIPISFLGAFAVMPLDPVDVTINMISLFGFLLVLGIIVDDAIIIGESAYTQTQKYGHNIDEVIRGAHHVAVPATFGVLTTVVAFVPTLFTEGVFAPMPAAFGWVVVLCLAFSLLESKWILPAHLAHSRPSDHGTWGKVNRIQVYCNTKLQNFITEVYRPLIISAIRHRYITAAFFIGALVLTAGLVGGGIVRFVMVPNMMGDFLRASLEMTEGSTEEQTYQGYLQMQNALDDINREFAAEHDGEELIRHALAYGENGRFVTFMLELTKNDSVRIQGETLANQWRERIGEIPGARVLSTSAAESMGGPAIAFKLSGSDLGQLRQASRELEEKLHSYQDTFDVRNSLSAEQDEIVLTIKPGAQVLGLTLSNLATQVRQAFYGAEAQRIQRGNDEVKVMVRYPQSDRRSLSDLQKMYIRTPDGTPVPLSAVADVSIEPGYSKLTRVNSERAVTVSAQVDKSRTEPGRITSDVSENFMPALLARYPTVSFGLDGESEETVRLMSSMFSGFALALFGVYALLAIPLKSYAQPLIIMGVIPFGIIGAIVGHIIVGIPFDMMSFFGVIALTGVVVNNSLLMVDFVNKAVDRGVSRMRAIVDSGCTRYRAIMLTSLTTFFGLVPMLLETSVQAQAVIPMAVSLGFGIIFATVITLVLIPCLYVILEDARHWLGRGTPIEAGRDASTAHTA